jgi:hypothetical protein
MPEPGSQRKSDRPRGAWPARAAPSRRRCVPRVPRVSADRYVGLPAPAALDPPVRTRRCSSDGRGHRLGRPGRPARTTSTLAIEAPPVAGATENSTAAVAEDIIAPRRSGSTREGDLGDDQIAPSPTLGRQHPATPAVVATSRRSSRTQVTRPGIGRLAVHRNRHEACRSKGCRVAEVVPGRVLESSVVGAPRRARALLTHSRAPPRQRRWPALGHGHQGGGRASSRSGTPKGPAARVRPQPLLATQASLACTPSGGVMHPGRAPRLPSPPRSLRSLRVPRSPARLAGRCHGTIPPRVPVGPRPPRGRGSGTRALSPLPSGRPHAPPLGPPSRPLLDARKPPSVANHR